jgi:hypothetical protein
MKCYGAVITAWCVSIDSAIVLLGGLIRQVYMDDTPPAKKLVAFSSLNVDYGGFGI